jgi:polyhydroxyalkanoate synthesis regulator phasin
MVCINQHKETPMLRTLLFILGGIGAMAMLAATLFATPTTPAGAAEPIGNAPSTLEQPAFQQGPNQARHLDRKMLTTALLKSTLDVTGLERDALAEALTNGQSLAQIAEANGSTADAIIQPVLDKARDRLDKAVQNGRISQERADELLDKLSREATQIVEDNQLGEKINALKERAEQLAVLPALVRTAADETGLTPQEIRQQLRDGASLETIVTDAGGDIQQVIDNATDAFRAAAEDAVTQSR